MMQFLHIDAGKDSAAMNLIDVLIYLLFLRLFNTIKVISSAVS